jgi:hypothetical protein
LLSVLNCDSNATIEASFRINAEMLKLVSLCSTLVCSSYLDPDEFMLIVLGAPVDKARKR